MEEGQRHRSTIVLLAPLVRGTADAVRLDPQFESFLNLSGSTFFR
jgi:hypothetical protein